jgi:hypothetical protein
MGPENFICKAVLLVHQHVFPHCDEAGLPPKQTAPFPAHRSNGEKILRHAYTLGHLDTQGTPARQEGNLAGIGATILCADLNRALQTRQSVPCNQQRHGTCTQPAMFCCALRHVHPAEAARTPQCETSLGVERAKHDHVHQIRRGSVPCAQVQHCNPSCAQHVLAFWSARVKAEEHAA